MTTPRIATELDLRSIDMRAPDHIKQAEDRLTELAGRFPGTKRQMMDQLPLFLMPHIVRRLTFFDHMYRQVLDVSGVIMEFGVRFGRDLAMLDSLRTLHEPLNYSRKIIGFDTFTGFPAIDDLDGDDSMATPGGLHTADGYETYLDDVLAVREQMAPFDHMKKFEICTGDGPIELEKYLDRNPQTIISMAYFDFDIYEPTKKCLELIKPHLTRGAVIGFDELNCAEFPGETVALKEVFGLDRFKISRVPGSNPGLPSYVVFD